MASKASWWADSLWEGAQTQTAKMTITEKLDVTFTDVQSGHDGTSNKAHKLLIIDSVTKEPVGSWTPVYDEGFDAKIKGKRFFAFSAYNCVESSSDAEDAEEMNAQSLINGNNIFDFLQT